MHTIQHHNIKAFIQLLYQKKTGALPPDNVLESWAQISDDEITFHLQKMTQQWGWTTERLDNEIALFLKLQSLNPNNTATSQQHISHNHTVSSPPKTLKTPTKGRKRNSGFYIIVLPLVALISYIGFQFYKFQNLETLYAITDNIAIRNAEGKTIGRMDIFSKNNNDISSLRAADDKIYNITVSADGKISESRRLLVKEATFQDFLLRKKTKYVYVNKNYLTANKSYNELQRTIFGDINNNSLELKNISSNIRKVIIGSISEDPSLSGLKIANTCNNSGAEYTSILKHTLNDGETFIVICKLSDNNYYKLKGMPHKNQYSKPEKVLLKLPQDSQLTELSNQNFLFRKINGRYFLFDCDKNNLQIFSNYDDKGDINYFNWSFDPI